MNFVSKEIQILWGLVISSLFLFTFTEAVYPGKCEGLYLTCVPFHLPCWDEEVPCLECEGPYKCCRRAEITF